MKTARDVNPDDLNRWRSLCDAATPGPWVERYGDVFNAEECYIAETDDIEKHDAAFIAAAREAVPACLDEIARLRRENEAMSAVVQAAHAVEKARDDVDYILDALDDKLIPALRELRKAGE